MKFRIEFTVPGELAQAPPYEEDVDDVSDLGDVLDEFVNDAGRVYGPGCKLVIERIA